LTEKKFPISEIYGPVVQGEGPLTGRPTVFIRMGGCDYRCSWCDSLYAVEAKYAKTWDKMNAETIVGWAREYMPVFASPGHVTLSGGNPAIHDLGNLVDLLHAAGYEVAVETQGSVFKEWLLDVDNLVVSPKPPSSGNVTPFGKGSALEKILGECYRGWYDGTPHPSVLALKIVVFDQADYDYAKEVHAIYGQRVATWLQVGTDVGKDSVDELLDKCRILQDMILRDPAMFDCHIGLQTHVLLHGHRRGI
jgi:7-carboxy-7-deazaguanine synthase